MRKRILVCDDDAVLRRALVLLLHDAYDVAEAGSGHEGLERLASEKPDLLLLDVQLPDMTGLDVLARLAERTQSPPVIMLSARTELETVGRALELGAHSYLTKPFDAQTVLHEVALLLEPAPPRKPSDRPWRVKAPGEP